MLFEDQMDAWQTDYPTHQRCLSGVAPVLAARGPLPCACALQAAATPPGRQRLLQGLPPQLQGNAIFNWMTRKD